MHPRHLFQRRMFDATVSLNTRERVVHPRLRALVWFLKAMWSQYAGACCAPATPIFDVSIRIAAGLNTRERVVHPRPTLAARKRGEAVSIRGSVLCTRDVGSFLVLFAGCVSIRGSVLCTRDIPGLQDLEFYRSQYAGACWAPASCNISSRYPTACCLNTRERVVHPRQDVRYYRTAELVSIRGSVLCTRDQA